MKIIFGGVQWKWNDWGC